MIHCIIEYYITPCKEQVKKGNVCSNPQSVYFDIFFLSNLSCNVEKAST